MGDTQMNDDVWTEVLSRLPAKTVSANKCVSKGWKSLISNHLFSQLHFQRTSSLSGLFLQRLWDGAEKLDYSYRQVAYISLGEDGVEIEENALEFLPEKVDLMASCNGLLCCRGFYHAKDSTRPRRRSEYGTFLKGKTMNTSKDIVIYVCNPTTKEYIALRPIGCHVSDSFGLAFYPFGSSTNTAASFKLVSIQHQKLESNLYSFVIFSSETGRWTISKEVCYWDSNIHKQTQVFVGGRIHWLTWNHHIITFDVEREVSEVIKLPGPIMKEKGSPGLRLGCSGNSLIYVCAHATEVRVWMLKDYHKAEWVLRNRLHLLEFYEEHQEFLSSNLFSALYGLKDYDETEFCPPLTPLAFYEEELFMNLDRRLLAYSFKTGKLEIHCGTLRLEGFISLDLTVLPYSVNLAAMNVLRGNSAEPNGNTSYAVSKTAQKRKRRTVKTKT